MVSDISAFVADMFYDFVYYKIDRRCS